MGAARAPVPSTFLMLWALLVVGRPCSCNVTRTDEPMSTGVVKKESRPRRDVLLLYNVVSCATRCNPIKLLGYGCYCGFMGAGVPIDPIDKCCQQHDRCYDVLPCPQNIIYFIPYKWSCIRGKPLCFGAQKLWHHASNCAYRMCECDRLFSECLRGHSCPKRKAACQSAPWRTLQNLLLGLSIAG